MPASGKRGFGSMDEAKQREIASKGGQAAHLKGSAHEFSPEEARQAGSKGGKAAHEKGSAHEFSSDEARADGRHRPRGRQTLSPAFRAGENDERRQARPGPPAHASGAHGVGKEPAGFL